MNGIKQIGGLQPLPNVQKAGTQKKQTGFADALKHYAEGVNEELQKADGKMEDLAVGKTSDLHEVVLATEKADLSFKLLLQVRNKLLEAYQQIMRMQV
ncbi:MAG: flagellar hook-basal body complex protein FliE [Thermoplasmata archaeon]|nr:MAG: flagellar hook-basal body complex protein FliE [Deltaproteobacteria bacterium]RLF57436.1 MAG: flagellar hook-basal body complex protein FliE [Thermoplasmata archaeon]HDZ23928.1 flagellar hook-basal body complex protein FliE [Desulfobacteraceae bacterium]